jgi:hypothetical protein
MVVKGELRQVIVVDPDGGFYCEDFFGGVTGRKLEP